MLMAWLVYTQMSPAMLRPLWTMVARPERAVIQHRAGRGEGVGATGADRGDVVFGSDHVPGAADDQRLGRVRHHEHGLEAAQHAVGAPVLGELHGGASELPPVLLQLALEALEQREGVGGAAGETRQHLALVETPGLVGIALEDGVTERHLAVGAERDGAVAAYGEYRRGAHARASGRRR